MKTDSIESIPRTCSHREVTNFVNVVANVYFYAGPDRRGKPRIPLTVPITIRRLDDRFCPLEHVVRGVTRNISESGIGIMCPDPVGTRFVSFKITSHVGVSVNVVAEVLRCEPVGCYYDVGCRFLVDGPEEEPVHHEL